MKSYVTILYLFSFNIGFVRYYNLFTDSTVDKHLGSFQFGVIQITRGWMHEIRVRVGLPSLAANTSFPLAPETWASLQLPASTWNPGFSCSPSFLWNVFRKDGWSN